MSITHDEANEKFYVDGILRWVTFKYHDDVITINKENYEDGKYESAFNRVIDSGEYDVMWRVSHPRDSRITPGGPFFKRWRGMWDEPEGYEFRPLRIADYGYDEDQTVITSWGNWALQTAGNFSIGTRKAFIVLFGAMLFNDYLLDTIIPNLGGGSSFVHNLQMGYNLHHYLAYKKTPFITKVAAGVGSFSVVLGSPFKEMYQGYDFGVATSHKAHYLGAGMGIVMGMLLKNL